MKKLILIAALTVAPLTATADLDLKKNDDCQLLAKAFQVMSTQLAQSLLFPITNYEFGASSPDADIVARHFSNASVCEIKSPDARDALFLLLSDMQSLWDIAAMERGHPSLIYRARDAFYTALTLLDATGVSDDLVPVLRKLEATMRFQARYRLPDSAELKIARLIARAAPLDEPGRRKLLNELFTEAEWLNETLRRDYSQNVSREDERWLTMRGAQVLLDLARLNTWPLSKVTEGERRRVGTLIDRLVDAIYGERQEFQFQVPVEHAPHLKTYETRHARLAFIKNSAPKGTSIGHLRGVPDSVREIAYHMFHDLQPFLRYYREKNVELMRDRLWGLAFLWNPSMHYLRTDANGMANPTAPAKLDPMIDQLYKAAPSWPVPKELALLARALRERNNQPWPVFERARVQLHPDAVTASSLLDSAAAQLEFEEMTEPHAGDLMPDSFDFSRLNEDRGQALQSIESARFRMEAMRPENRIKAFKRRLGSCENDLETPGNVIPLRRSQK